MLDEPFKVLRHLNGKSRSCDSTFNMDIGLFGFLMKVNSYYNCCIDFQMLNDL